MTDQAMIALFQHLGWLCCCSLFVWMLFYSIYKTTLLLSNWRIGMRGIIAFKRWKTSDEYQAFLKTDIQERVEAAIDRHSVETPDNPIQNPGGEK